MYGWDSKRDSIAETCFGESLVDLIQDVEVGTDLGKAILTKRSRSRVTDEKKNVLVQPFVIIEAVGATNKDDPGDEIENVGISQV